MLDTSGIHLVLFLIIMVVAIPLHELGHALAADYCGDDIPSLQGRTTLEPWAHWDPLGSLLIALGIFGGYPVIGWGKPVMTDPTRYRNGSIGRLLVASAGILVNLALALVGALVYRGLHLASGDPFEGMACYSFVTVNLYLALFNLLPIPPLDGSKILFWNHSSEGAIWSDWRITAGGFLVLWILVIYFRDYLSVPVEWIGHLLLGP